MPGENILQTLVKIATLTSRLDKLAEEVRELRDSASGRLVKLEDLVADLRERVARLESSREADRAQIQAEITRFQAGR